MSAREAARDCDRQLVGGTIVPRNDFIQPAQNKTDIRVQQRIPLGGRMSIDLLADAFNVFNRPNWGSRRKRAARTTVSGRRANTARCNSVSG
jgi:hypothetical protein